MTTFEALGVAEPLVKALADRGITEAFPIQELSLPDGLAGRDVCGKAKTGSGKTLAFGLAVIQQLLDGEPAEPRSPLALALVPTRELAVQVTEELAELSDVRVSSVYGGADIEKQIKMLARGVDFVVATPGRMIDLLERKELSIADVAHVIVDEADRMADMGFLPQVEWILRNIEGTHQTLLYSATLDGVVDGLIKRYQTDPGMHEVEEPQVIVDEMTHRFLYVHQMDKVKVAAAIANSSDRTIIFSRTKHGCDRLERNLQKEGVKAAAIHGDLRQNAREKALNDFSSGKLPVLVATDVAARGIHVDDVGIVIHFDPPDEHKTYLHRSGRTARAGDEGLVVTFVLWDQELEVKRMQKRLGLDIPIVEMFSNNEALADLSNWDPHSGA
jgi:superfamily II DNA/RNA helicase